MVTWGDMETTTRRYDGPRRLRLIAGAETGEVESTSDYAERFWLPIVGPTSLLLHRRLTRMIGQWTDWTDTEFLAGAVGVSRRTESRRSPFGRTLARLEQFGWVRQGADGLTLYVRTRLPLLTDRQAKELPDGLIAEHDQYLTERRSWIGCPAPGCGAKAREGDLAGQAAHMTAQHPHIVAQRQAESARWAGWEND